MGAGAIFQGLTNGLTAARTGQLQGQQIANQRATQQAIEEIVQERAMQQMQIENQLRQAQTQEALAMPGIRQGMMNAAQSRAQAEWARANRPSPLQFVPNAAVPTVVDPTAPGGVRQLPNVPTAPRAATPAQVSERERQQGWRQAFSRRVAELQQPQADPTNPFVKAPGLSYDDAKTRAAQEATDAWGPPPQGFSGPTGPRAVASPQGGSAGRSGASGALPAGMVPAAEAAKRQAWMQANPKQPNETMDQWRQRYLSSSGGTD